MMTFAKRLLRFKFIFFLILMYDPRSLANQTGNDKSKSSVLSRGIESISDTVNTVTNERPIHIWERYVQKYRKGHHFIVSTGVTEGSWQVGRMGTITNETFGVTGVFGQVSYTFYLPIYEGFGYSLGSTMGYFSEQSRRSEDFDAASTLDLPGVDFGLDYNINPGFRLFTKLSYGISRISGVIEQDGESAEGAAEDSEIFINLTRVVVSAGVDYFFSLNWAFRVQVGDRFMKYKKPVISEGEPVPVDASFDKEEREYGIALVYHFL